MKQIIKYTKPCTLIDIKVRSTGATAVVSFTSDRTFEFDVVFSKYPQAKDKLSTWQGLVGQQVYLSTSQTTGNWQSKNYFMDIHSTTEGTKS